MAITLAELKTECRQRADMENSNFITPEELTSYINNSISELHDILIQAYESDYYIKEATFTTTNNQDTYALSTVIADNDFYKIRGVDAKLNNQDWSTLKPFQFNERNKRQNFGGWNYLGIANVRYRLVGSNITFTPIPDSNIECRIWYIPVAVTLNTDTDELQDLNNFSEYVIVDAAIKMMQKEESDTTVLQQQKAALKRRIEEAANNRDAGEGQAISDVYNENDNFLLGRSSE
jgi:hypothetical protein